MEGYTEVIFYIKDEHVQRFLNGLAGHFGYRDTLEGGQPNPETRAQYTRRKIMQDWRGKVLSYERGEAIKALVDTPIDINDGT